METYEMGMCSGARERGGHTEVHGPSGPGAGTLGRTERVLGPHTESHFHTMSPKVQAHWDKDKMAGAPTATLGLYMEVP